MPSRFAAASKGSSAVATAYPPRRAAARSMQSAIESADLERW